MGAPTFQKGIGGVTPLGSITITPGTPISVLANLNVVDQFFVFTCRQLGFMVLGTPSGNVYVNYGNTAGLGKQTGLIIPSAVGQASLPLGSECQESLIDATKWYLDGDAACVVAIYAEDASS